MASNHHRRPCIRCPELTRSASGLCFECRPAPTVTVNNNVVCIGAIDIPADKALVLAHRLLDALTPTMERRNKHD